LEQQFSTEKEGGMLNRKMMAAGLVAILCTNAWGRFVQPSDKQIADAAANPDQIAALLGNASIAQAADVTVAVIARIAGLGLPRSQRDARVAAIVSAVFSTMPGQANALAAVLGARVAASPSASGDPALLSAIQQAVIVTAGPAGSTAGRDAGNAFGNAYNLAMQSVAGAPGGGKTAPPTPPPPPVATPYLGQAI
jgi:hypothetical protein